MKTFSSIALVATLVVAFFLAVAPAAAQLLTLPVSPFPPPQAEWELPYLLNSYGYVVAPSSCEPYTYIAFNAEGEYEEYTAPNGSTYIRYFSTPQPEMDCDTQGTEFTTVQWWFRWPGDLSGTPAQFQDYSDQTRFDAEFGVGECYSDLASINLDAGGVKIILYQSESGSEEGWRTYDFVWPSHYQEGDLVVLAAHIGRFTSEACNKLQAMDPTFLVKLGLIIVLNENPSGVPDEFRLDSAYPNPFNPSTVIPFELSEASEVTLAVYDMLGREVDLLFKAHLLSAGRHEAHFNAEGLPSGVYLVRLTAGEKVLTNRVTLLQ